MGSHKTYIRPTWNVEIRLYVAELLHNYLDMEIITRT